MSSELIFLGVKAVSVVIMKYCPTEGFDISTRITDQAEEQVLSWLNREKSGLVCGWTGVCVQGGVLPLPPPMTYNKYITEVKAQRIVPNFCSALSALVCALPQYNSRFEISSRWLIAQSRVPPTLRDALRRINELRCTFASNHNQRFPALRLPHFWEIFSDFCLFLRFAFTFPHVGRVRASAAAGGRTGKVSDRSGIHPHSSRTVWRGSSGHRACFACFTCFTETFVPFKAGRVRVYFRVGPSERSVCEIFIIGFLSQTWRRKNEISRLNYNLILFLSMQTPPKHTNIVFQVLLLNLKLSGNKNMQMNPC